MQQKLRANPIFVVLKHVHGKKVSASPKLCHALQTNLSSDNKAYFLISLDDAQTSEKLETAECKILGHHISVYEKFNDKNIIYSAYHYTATIVINDQRYTLHGYFNKFGELIDILVKDTNENPFNELEKWQSLFQKISTLYTVDIFAEVFNIIDSVSNEVDTELQEIGTKLDQISEDLYSENSAPCKVMSASKLYIKTIQQFIDWQKKYNEVSLTPNRANIHFLETALKNFVLPEAATSLGRTPKKNKEKRRPKQASVEKKTQIPRVKKSFSEKHTHLIPTIPLDIQKILLRVDEIDKTATADNILEQHALLKECASRLVEIPESIAMDIFINQNTLNKKAKVAVKMFIAIGDTRSVNQLLPLVPTISQSMICTAAEKGHTEVLSSLLKRYKGPKKFSKPFSDNIYVELTPEETLSTRCLEALIRFGCNPNAVDTFGRSLLYIAVTLDDIDRVKMLLDAGVNINQRTTKAIHRLGMVPEIRFNDPKASKQKIKALEKFASNEVNKKVKVISDKIPLISSTPIMAAVQKRILPIVKLLKEHRCDFSISSDEGMNAYSTALIRPVDNPNFTLNEELITYLIAECGLDINMLHGLPDKKSSALFHLVLYKVVVPDIAKDIEILLNFNANPNLLCDIVTQYGQKATISSFKISIVHQAYDLAELMLNQSRVQISQEDIIDAIEMIELFKPEYVSQFKQLCAHHAQRFTPIPKLSDDRNAFFNSSDLGDSPSSAHEYRQ
jgi:hypothetical protein